MTDIMPSILAPNAEEFARKLHKVEGLVQTVHIDCLDGTLFPQKSFFELSPLSALPSDLHYDLHLMVADPRATIDAWKKQVPTFLRATFHAEVVENLHLLAEWTLSRGVEACVALNPETSVRKVRDLLLHLHSVLVMGVHPGKGGQTMLRGTVERVRELKAAAPYLVIAVDGGVNLENAPALIAAGATRLIVGNAIFEAKNPKSTIKALQSL